EEGDVSVYDRGAFAQRPHAGVAACLLELTLQELPALDVDARGEQARKLVHLDPGVPHVEVALLCEAVHRLTVGRDGLQHRGGNVLALERPVPTGDADARGEALHIPFPGAGQGLVEVVDVEDQLPLRRGEGTEVRQVRVTAEL